MTDETETKPVFRWDIVVRRWDTYGNRILSTTPMTILASTRDEMIDKARTAFSASYDSFRKFWSHDVLLNSVDEETQ